MAGWRRSRNQSLSWPKESGASSPSSRRRRTAVSTGAPDRAASISAASPATVGRAKKTRRGSSTPKAPCTRASIRAASSEWPPREKKSSSLPTLSTPSSASQIPASSSSTEVSGRHEGLPGEGDVRDRDLRGEDLFPNELRGDWEVRETDVRIRGDRLEDRLQRREQALHGHGVEEVGRGFDRGREAPARLGEGEREVELGRSAVDPLRGKPGQRAGRDAGPPCRLQREEHLEQRVGSRAALRRQSLDNLFQGEVRARDRRQSIIARLGQEVAERQVTPWLAAQHDRVDEKAEEPVQLFASPGRHGRAHEEIAPAGGPEEEGLESGEEEREGGRPLFPGELAEARRETVRQRRPPGHAAEAWDRGPGPVRGKGEQARCARQALPLTRQTVDESQAAQRRALPERHVRLLEGRLRERLPGVEGRQLVPEQVERPAVRHRVVLDDEKPVILRADLRESRPEERSAGQVERAPSLLFERRRVDPRQVDRGRRQHLAPGLARGGIGQEHRAQHLMAPCHLGERRRECVPVEGAGDPEGDRHVVGRDSGVEAVQEPEPLLAEGERSLLAVRPPPQDRRLRRGFRQSGLDLRREPRDRGPGKKRAEGKLHSKGSLHAGEHPDREQRMAAQGEEVVLDPHPLGFEHRRPDPGDQLLDAGPGRREALRPARRRARAGPSGPACPLRSAGTPEGTRRPTAPCSPAAAPPPRRGAPRDRLRPACRPRSGGPPAGPRAPRRPPRARPDALRARRRSPPARCGSPAPSPGDRSAPGSRARRPAAGARGRPSGTAARPASPRTDRGSTSPP